MPLYATTKTADELKRIGPYFPPEKSRTRRAVVTHTPGDDSDVFVQVQCHGNLYLLRPSEAVEVPEISRRRFKQALGGVAELGIIEVMPGSPEYAKVRFGDHRPVEAKATKSAPPPLPPRDVLMRFPKDELVALASWAGADVPADGSKGDICDAIDRVRG